MNLCVARAGVDVRRLKEMASPFQQLNVDPQLACEFLGVFARCEFALKAGGFAQGDANGVNANWDLFAQTIDGHFDPTQSDDLSHAVEYLLNHPPRKQILINNHIEWRDAAPDANLTRAERVLLMVRRVRNNLFHGGKFLAPEGAENDRDQLLVQHSLTVLRACILLSAQVTAAYEH